MATRLCYCRCHQASEGDLRSALQLEVVAGIEPWSGCLTITPAVEGVRCDDPEAAAVACAMCRDHHCAALATPRPEPPERAEWVDSD